MAPIHTVHGRRSIRVINGFSVLSSQAPISVNTSFSKGTTGAVAFRGPILSREVAPCETTLIKAAPISPLLGIHLLFPAMNDSSMFRWTWKRPTAMQFGGLLQDRHYQPWLQSHNGHCRDVRLPCSPVAVCEPVHKALGFVGEYWNPYQTKVRRWGHNWWAVP